MNSPQKTSGSKVSVINGIVNAAHSVENTYEKATQGLQNYGRNIRRNIDSNQKAFQNRSNNSGYYQTKNPFPNPFDPKSYQ